MVLASSGVGMGVGLRELEPLVSGGAPLIFDLCTNRDKMVPGPKVSIISKFTVRQGI